MEPTRPSLDVYYMNLAVATAARAACGGQKVGAVIVRENRVVSTGYNGTPEQMGNCAEGTCPRCTHRSPGPGRPGFTSGQALDNCICVHAEQNAVLAAARYGVSVGGASMYTTHAPCLTCSKELIQAGIRKVFFVHAYAAPNAPVSEELKERVDRELAEVMEVMSGRLDVEPLPFTAVLGATAQALDNFQHSQGVECLDDVVQRLRPLPSTQIETGKGILARIIRHTSGRRR